MEEKKKERSSKARTLTRRIKELHTTIGSQAQAIDVQEKIAQIKYTFEELGTIQDELLDTCMEEEANYDEIVTWYDKYDYEVNKEIVRAQKYLQSIQL